MNFKTIPMLDLFQHGNYVNSFHTLEDVMEYLRHEASEFADPTWYMNQRKYTIIESKHIVMN